MPHVNFKPRANAQKRTSERATFFLRRLPNDAEQLFAAVICNWFNKTDSLVFAV
jgi:hypothetical protein